MIEVGGMQIQKEIEPLDPKIQKFLDEAKDGAIFVSFGSNVLINKLPEEKLNAITNAFKAHPNYRVLIKSDEHIVIPSHKQSDVLVEPWFNQQSILAHENVKLFITHGGLLSTTGNKHSSPISLDSHSMCSNFRGRSLWQTTRWHPILLWPISKHVSKWTERLWNQCTHSIANSQ